MENEKNLDPEDNAVINDRMLYAIVRGIPDKHTEATLGIVNNILDKNDRLSFIRLAQWTVREELLDGSSVGEDYRRMMRVLGCLEQREEEITGETSPEWIVWPRIKRVEMELKN